MAHDELACSIPPRERPLQRPGVYLDFSYGRRAILFDLGDVGGLSSRELLRVSHVFVSHTHVDHVAGFDRLFRLCLHRPSPLTLIGPPGFAVQVEHRIRSFTWNLLDENSVDFCIRAMDYDGSRLVKAAEFHAREAFARRDREPPAFPEGIAWMEDEFKVEAAALDHGIPSLAFALREVLQVNVWRGVLGEMGLPPAPGSMRRNGPFASGCRMPIWSRFRQKAAFAWGS
ncbi:hypothetical protein ACFQY9_18525 [Microvirga aerilata]|uniref:hypothetical protein n=1 Tax=Microvirga aerilata TaxID=670292 RepID=UPI0036457F6F